MIILDTNVISEPMRSNGNPFVLAWLDRHSAEALYMTTTSLAELLLGIELLLPVGRRREGLGLALAHSMTGMFGSRILPFDEPPARVYATLVGRARAEGRSIGMADGQIAAIAIARGFSVATRDASPFEAAGVAVIDPWTER